MCRHAGFKGRAQRIPGFGYEPRRAATQGQPVPGRVSGELLN